MEPARDANLIVTAAEEGAKGEARARVGGGGGGGGGGPGRRIHMADVDGISQTQRGIPKRSATAVHIWALGK